MKNRILFRGCQPLPRTAEPQLNSECCGKQNIDLFRCNFLQVARGDFRPLHELILRQAFADPFPAHVDAKEMESLPFVLQECRALLRCILVISKSEAFQLKSFAILLARTSAGLRVSCSRTYFI